MKFRTFIPALAAVLALAGGSAAQAVTIDFEGISTGLTELADPTDIGGLTFDTNFHQYVTTDQRAGDLAAAQNGTDYYLNGFHGASITRTGGGAFKLLSFDLGRADYTNTDFQVTFTYNFAAGGSTSETYAISDLTFHAKTFSLADLSSVSIGSVNGYVGLDNLSYSVGSSGPEPGSWALMIAGFGLAGGALRRRAVAA